MSTQNTNFNKKNISSEKYQQFDSEKKNTLRRV